jgi:lipoate---protein ligase
LMYSVVLSYQLRPELRMIDRAHAFVLETIATSLRGIFPGAARAGISDLVLGDRKFSGNSLRCKRTHFLYHGTLLYQFPNDRMGALLKMPARQPEYRRQRSHIDFLMNLPLEAHQLRQALISAFGAMETRSEWPRAMTAQLVAEKYSRADWNERF